MSTRAQVADARAALARQLASLRRAVGLSQAQAGRCITYSRSQVARGEAAGVYSRDFCRLAGQLHGAGDQLALVHDRIDALADAARTQAARQNRHPAAATPPTRESATAVVDLDTGCPHCARPIAVLVRQSDALVPLQSAGRPHATEVSQ